MDGRKRGTGVEPLRSCIRVTFVFNGKRCRETLPLAPTSANIKATERLMSRVFQEIELGVFDYGTTFPHSKRATTGSGFTSYAECWLTTIYLRAVCQNRQLWGVEKFQEISIRHSKFAAGRFAHQAAPALESYADSSPRHFIDGIRSARERIVARTDEDRENFLRKRGFSKTDTGRVIEMVLAEEGHPPSSVYDFVQGITALARGKPHQDARLELEGKARPLLERAR